MTGSLNQQRVRCLECQGCGLSETRHKVVFGEGPEQAPLMFIGEAPGRQEDQTGRPFCGRSGKLLDGALESSGISRESTFVTSIVKCRPPGNRNPKANEIAACSTWLEGQVKAIKPRVVSTLGNFALHVVRSDKTGISRLHGKPESVRLYGLDVILFPLFHPAAALRSNGTKALFEADVEALAKLVERT